MHFFPARYAREFIYTHHVLQKIQESYWILKSQNTLFMEKGKYSRFLGDPRSNKSYLSLRLSCSLVLISPLAECEAFFKQMHSHQPNIHLKLISLFPPRHLHPFFFKNVAKYLLFCFQWLQESHPHLIQSWEGSGFTLSLLSQVICPLPHSCICSSSLGSRRQT